MSDWRERLKLRKKADEPESCDTCGKVFENNGEEMLFLSPVLLGHDRERQAWRVTLAQCCATCETDGTRALYQERIESLLPDSKGFWEMVKEAQSQGKRLYGGPPMTWDQVNAFSGGGTNPA
jgi:hypothetical protein